MKLIFLDFDGVLNSNDYFDSTFFKQETNGLSWEEIMLIAHYTHIDPVAVKILNQLVEISGAQVIVSSTWRLKYTVEELNSMLKDRGATFQIVGATPKITEYITGWGSFTVPRG